MTIILLGYRGCGKTSAGRQLAERRGWAFADLDTMVCDRFDGRTVAQIWANEGEPRYREVEVQITREVVTRPDTVIALGGGAAMQAGAREAIAAAAAARRIYLAADPVELHRRISGDAASAALRPALTAAGGGLEEVRAVLAERDPVYRSLADHVLDVTALPLPAVVDTLDHFLAGGVGPRGDTGNAGADAPR